jgi:hypothetical protein
MNETEGRTKRRGGNEKIKTQKQRRGRGNIINSSL